MSSLERFVALEIIGSQVKKKGYTISKKDIQEFNQLTTQELECEFEFWIK